MAQYPIPQFIEAEGKIIPFLTFKQFFWLVGGGAVAILIFYTLPFFMFVIGVVVIGLFIAVVAFLKIDNVSVPTIVINYIMFSTKSKNYVWKKKEIPYPFTLKKSHNTVNPEITNGLQTAKKIVEYRKK